MWVCEYVSIWVWDMRYEKRKGIPTRRAAERGLAASSSYMIWVLPAQERRPSLCGNGGSSSLLRSVERLSRLSNRVRPKTSEPMWQRRQPVTWTCWNFQCKSDREIDRLQPKVIVRYSSNTVFFLLWSFIYGINPISKFSLFRKYSIFQYSIV